MPRHVSAPLGSLLCFALMSCSENTAPDNTPASVTVTPPASITATVESRMMADADTVPITVVARDANNLVIANPSVTFSTSNAAVASVVNGKIVGHMPGTATVSVDIGTLKATINLDVYLGRGRRIPEMLAIDSAIVGFMRANAVPGAVVAVMRSGKLLMTRAYGLADSATKRAVGPTDLFRIGSNSKPLLGITTMRLIENGQLSMTDRPFALLSNLPALQGETEDPRLAAVTVRQLLDHATGWNTNRSVDDRVWEGVWRYGVVRQDSLFRYGRGVALATNPGTQYAYANYNAQVLAQLIEKVTGTSFESYVQTNILAPLGITRMRYGKTSPAQRQPDEVNYYEPTYAINVAPGGMEYYGASGSWLASAPDLMRFLAGIDGAAGKDPLLTNASITQLLAPEPYESSASFYYSGFWQVQRELGGSSMFHSGAADGAFSFMERRADGVAFAVIVNRGLRTGPTPVATLLAAIGKVTTWPTADLFSVY